ncbi:MAG: class I SAM-dependent methyltransferase [Neisseria sp.]|nr:class I SAM-dependent methyltransferase [Neisseria sp.]
MTSLANEKLAQSYNELPYPSKAFAHCSPVRLHALAKMKGLEPVPLENAKVLEIGCSFGGNLLPFALQFPDSFSIGIDLSETHIREGQRMLSSAGISNISLVAADISKVRFETQFDYIVCHGVFSWVPEFVQHAILSTIRQYLSPNGIAFVSYNAYPGWKNKDIAKDLMLFGSQADLPIQNRVYQALEMIKFTRDIFKSSEHVFHRYMNECFEHISEASESYIAHEYLEDFNQPMYFKQFVRLAAQFGLAYVTDTNTPYIFRNGVDEEKMNHICSYFNNRLDDITQYFDFLSDTKFRCDMITGQENLDRHQLTNSIVQFNSCRHFDDLYLRIVPPYLATENDKEYWFVAGKVKFSRSEAADLLFDYLRERVGNCQIKRIYADLKKCAGFDRETIQMLLWMIVHSNYSHISFYPIQIKSCGKKPKISDSKRNLLQFISSNPDITGYTDIYGNNISIREVTVYFSRYLDGTRTIKGLIKAYREELKTGGLIMRNLQGEDIPFEDIPDEAVEREVKSILEELTDHGYFN